MILLENIVREDMERSISEVGGRHNQGERSDLHYVHCDKNGHDAKTCRIPWEKIKEKGTKGRKR
jgi:hypothetical protein